jgi:hypothetical protein
MRSESKMVVVAVLVLGCARPLFLDEGALRATKPKTLALVVRDPAPFEVPQFSQKIFHD